MNKQSTFDLVVAHLRQQGRQARNHHSCVLRTDKGLACAVGCLVPDHEYHPGLEGLSVMDPWAYDLRDLLERLGHDIEILGCLQIVHDSAECWDRCPDRFNENGEDELRAIAEAHHLEYRPVSGRSG